MLAFLRLYRARMRRYGDPTGLLFHKIIDLDYELVKRGVPREVIDRES